jgi:hypothetical protein
MDLVLTSFGVSHLQRRDRRDRDIFYRLPPVSLASSGQEFLPDYAALLIADRIVIDRRTYDLLIRGQHRSFGHIALMAKILHDEGFVRLEDFDSVIAQNRDLLEAMLERDLRELDSWVKPFKDSAAEWRRFMERFRRLQRRYFVAGRPTHQEATSDERAFYDDVSIQMKDCFHGIGNYSPYTHHLVEEALGSSRKRRESKHRDALREVLTEYLSYVNANLLLANTFGTGLHDWCDFRPFYRDKFLRVARAASPGQAEIDNVTKLFAVSFPEFAFWRPESIVRALKDKRIADLRRLVETAVAGEVEFDREFAARVLGEVLKIERSVGKLRNFVSYITAPLGFIPVVGTPVQKVVEEAVVQPVAHHRRKEHRWFYLISELSDHVEGQKS